jgi:predicted NodU family carbamoyl transferase
VVNRKNSTAYNMAKFVAVTLNLPVTYNIKNSIQLFNDLNSIPINESTRICLFDIKDMYTDIPQQDATHIIQNIVLKNDENMADYIQNMLQTILQQNYFHFDNQYYKQNIGLAVGVPTSVIIAGTYLQSLEHNQVYNFLTKHKIIGYFRYVDDILIIYDKNKTQSSTQYPPQ